MRSTDIIDHEKRFQSFSNKLLQAQKYEFLNPNPFGRDTLKKTLESFCEIIADELNALSCTVQLRLYDPKDENAKGKGDISNKIITWHLSYPYGKYEKGGVQLVATNKNSPWNSEEHFVAGDSYGITLDILQDRMARVKDPMSIRFSRNFKKLGKQDYRIWKNENWNESFKNYYGVPIRIHPDGEIIGILKVENKLFERINTIDNKSNDVRSVREIIKVLNITIADLKTKDKDLEFINEIVRIVKELHGLDNSKNILKNFQQLKLSFLSLFNLIKDLVSVNDRYDDKTLQELIFTPWPRNDNGIESGITEDQFGSLIPDDNMAVVQLVTETLDDEWSLWECVLSNSTEKGTDNDIFTIILAWYNIFVSVISENFKYDKKYSDNLISEWIESINEKLNNSFLKVCDIIPWCNDKDVKLLHFYFKFEFEIMEDDSHSDVNKNDDAKCKDNIFLYLYMPPTRLCKIDSSWFIEGGKEIVKNYNDLMSMIYIFSNSSLESKYYRGEVIEGTKDLKLTDYEYIDLLVDRWAARTQFLNYAIPSKEFDIEDCHKLSWAAFEIGKLIEREISYKASYGRDPIPLTAMEFFRIPISDYCFIDDLRKRRQDASRVKAKLEYQISNDLMALGLEKNVRYKSRVKDVRSYLERIGERHDGYVRGNIAIWFYLLAKWNDVNSEDKDNSSTILSEETNRFDNNLKSFAEDFESTAKDMSKEHDDELKAIADYLEFSSGYEILVDTHFVSFPLLPGELEKTRLDGFLDGIITNLAKPKEKESICNDDGFTIHDAKISNLIFRMYEHYVISSVSLYIQLYNQKKCSQKKVTFSKFYSICYKFRNILMSTQKDIDEDVKFKKLEDLFGSERASDTSDNKRNRWVEMISYIQKVSTEEYITNRDNDEKTEITVKYLNKAGIYKRLRHVNNTLWHQRSVAHLDWELSKFDLLGARLNCMLNSQVFAVYEKLWRNGEPFCGETSHESNENRLPWISTRTKIQRGEYNAFHISALMEPDITTVNSDGIALHHLRRALNDVFKTNPNIEGFREKYKQFYEKRNIILEKYMNWQQIANNVIEKNDIPDDFNEDDIWFGTFLGESAISLLMILIERFKELENNNVDQDVLKCECNKFITVFNIIEKSLSNILTNARQYSNDVLKYATTTNRLKVVSNAISDLQSNAEELYSRLMDLKKIFSKPIEKNNDYGNNKYCDYVKDMLIKLSNLMHKKSDSFEDDKEKSTDNFPMTDNDLNEWGAFLNVESNYFNQYFKDNNDGIITPIPIIYLKDYINYSLKKHKIPLVGNSESINECKAHMLELYDQLKLIRQTQKAYLFHEGDCNKTNDSSLALCLRNENGVRHRIENYVLLYNAKEAEEAESSLCSRDLFYYLRSLIPVEIQIRTEFSNKFAKQNHNSVYKGRPPRQTLHEVQRMKYIGNELDFIDQEMEVDFGVYITKYAQQKNAEKKHKK